MPHTPALLAQASAEVLLCLPGSSCDDMLNEVYNSLTNINSKLACLPYKVPTLLTGLLPLKSGCHVPAALKLQWQYAVRDSGQTQLACLCLPRLIAAVGKL